MRYENKERRACREMVEIDCITGPRHRDFIYCIPTSPRYIFALLDMLNLYLQYIECLVVLTFLKILHIEKMLCMAKANQAVVSDSWVILFLISLIQCDRMGLAGPVKQQMFCSNVTPRLPKIPSGSACV